MHPHRSGRPSNTTKLGSDRPPPHREVALGVAAPKPPPAPGLLVALHPFRPARDEEPAYRGPHLPPGLHRGVDVHVLRARQVYRGCRRRYAHRVRRCCCAGDEAGRRCLLRTQHRRRRRLYGQL
ncbi:unnamed protein product [Ectocarpus sp. 12 AP-2014]